MTLKRSQFLLYQALSDPFVDIIESDHRWTGVFTSLAETAAVQSIKNRRTGVQVALDQRLDQDHSSTGVPRFVLFHLEDGALGSAVAAPEAAVDFDFEFFW